MKKHLLNKTLLRKLEGKKPGKASQTLEKKVRTSLTEQARKLMKDLHAAELELSAMRAHAPGDWLWLADIRHAGYLMTDVLEVLRKGADATTSPIAPPKTPGETGDGGALAWTPEFLLRPADFPLETTPQETP